MQLTTALSPRLLRHLFTALLLSGFFISGCASTPQAPTSALDAARMAVVTAERFDAGRFASPELGEARQRLALANAAVAEERMVEAQRLAIEARVMAELAYSKTEAAKAAAINAEMQRGADALSEEMDRTGEQQ